MEELNELKQALIRRKFIPLDKSWIIRMGFLDIVNGYDDIIKFLKKQKDLGEDINALLRVAEKWETREPLDVGESGTIYRLFRFYLWKNKIKRELIKRGTLKNRQICDNPEIVDWPIKKLLTLDGGSSQWANASILCGNIEKIKNSSRYLNMTYEAIKYWKEKRKRNETWEPRFDGTLLPQTVAFISFVRGEKFNFDKKVLDDCDLYCFFRAFNIINKEQGEKKWPHIVYHESNRIKEMEEQLKNYKQGKEITLKDHRVAQAIAMLALVENKQVRFSNPECVNKTWPQFWEFLKYVEENYKNA